MEKGLLHIRCEITLGKYQDQLLRLEDDFVSMPNDEINRYMKMEKLLENKISRRFKVRRLEIDDFGYLMEHLYGRDGIAYEDYEYQLPICMS